jgi:5-formyltetrahydrofolate cyclo-ligase
MIASVADSKSDLRARIRAARAQVDPVARASERAGLLATARAAGLLDPRGAAGTIGVVAIAAYIAAPGEPDVADVRSAVLAAGGVVLLPIPRADRSLDWAHDDGHYRPHGRFPIEVPAGEVVGSGAAGLLAHGVRTVLVPALAVDATGARLGQGGGYYDRLLAALATRVGASGEDGGASREDRGASSGDGATSAPRPSAEGVRIVAVVRDDEVLPAGAVPREAHDQPMTAALTPTRYVQLEP